MIFPTPTRDRYHDFSNNERQTNLILCQIYFVQTETSKMRKTDFQRLLIRSTKRLDVCYSANTSSQFVTRGYEQIDFNRFQVNYTKAKENRYKFTHFVLFVTK